MKILLDENLDHRLRKHLAPHEAVTASFLGWNGLKNGKLLEAAEQGGFDVLITGDQTLSYEQNLTRTRLAIIALSSIEWRIIKDYLFEIQSAVNAARPGSFQAVNCGTFTRKTPRSSQ